MRIRRYWITVLALLGIAALAIVAINYRTKPAPGPVADGLERSRSDDSRAPREHLTPAARGQMMAQIQAARARRLARAAAGSERNASETAARSSGKNDAKEGGTKDTTQQTSELPTPSRDYIRRQIAEIRPLLEECVAKNSANPVEGMMQVSFTIDGEPGVGGLVRDSRIVDGTIPMPTELVACVEATLTSMTVAPPEAGGVINVNYPFAIQRSGAVDGPGLRDPALAPTSPGSLPGFLREAKPPPAQAAGARG
ncbi:MAG TPA: hypothetical protein VJR89_06225 [Polyangiales bacterium]|nr:hypothetical protein [Polyangiales bacterium]